MQPYLYSSLGCPYLDNWTCLQTLIEMAIGIRYWSGATQADNSFSYSGGLKTDQSQTLEGGGGGH